MILSSYGIPQEERRIRRWRTGINEQVPWRLRGYQGYGYAQVPEVIGGLVAEEEAANDGNSIKWGAVATGVLTGVSVWIATRMLERLFKK